MRNKKLILFSIKKSRDFIEIKKSASFTMRMLNPINTFMGENNRGFLLYRGEEKTQRGNIHIMPYGEYLLAQRSI